MNESNCYYVGDYNNLGWKAMRVCYFIEQKQVAVIFDTFSEYQERLYAMASLIPDSSIYKKDIGFGRYDSSDELQSFGYSEARGVIQAYLLINLNDENPEKPIQQLRELFTVFTDKRGESLETGYMNFIKPEEVELLIQAIKDIHKNQLGIKAEENELNHDRAARL